MLMKERYRTVTVCLSLLNLALVFAVASDEELSRICIPLAFFAGTLLYGTERHMTGKAGKKTGSRFQGIFALLFLAAAVFSVLHIGGLL